MNKYPHKPIIDCPYCGAKPPITHYLGGGPGFDGVRVCGNGCGTWDDNDEQRWWKIYHDIFTKKLVKKWSDVKIYK